MRRFTARGFGAAVAQLPCASRSALASGTGGKHSRSMARRRPFTVMRWFQDLEPVREKLVLGPPPFPRMPRIAGNFTFKVVGLSVCLPYRRCGTTWNGLAARKLVDLETNV